MNLSNYQVSASTQIATTTDKKKKSGALSLAE